MLTDKDKLLITKLFRDLDTMRSVINYKGITNDLDNLQSTSIRCLLREVMSKKHYNNTLDCALDTLEKTFAIYGKRSATELREFVDIISDIAATTEVLDVNYK
jgi:hypothetical protein